MLQYFLDQIEKGNFEGLSEKAIELGKYMTEEEIDILSEKLKIKSTQYKLMLREVSDEL